METPMDISVNISDLYLEKSFYSPGEEVQLRIDLEFHSEAPTPVRIIVELRHLSTIEESIESTIVAKPGSQSIDLHLSPPPTAPRGYGVDVCIETDPGNRLACGSIALDVLNSWTEHPRYGFLTDFFPERSDVSLTMECLTRYHINGLQFYDWMYRHDQFLTDTDPYRDPLDRLLSRETVDELIKSAHEHNIAAMPYTAIYAASIPFYEDHKDWALYQANGKPFLLGENFLVYMDPRPDSPWTHHLLNQFEEVLNEMAFDGIHLDQYGDPKEGFDAQGNRFDLAEPLAATINATKVLVRSHRPNGAVVFNAVTNWPIETVARSDQDFIYIEVWPPYIWFDDLHKLITRAQDLGGGKPVVLAAYIDPTLEYNARINNAVIFASGGGHIELGECDGMLAEPYFPNYKKMSPELSTVMQRYYDFAVRYQDVIGPRTIDATQDYHQRIEIDGVSTQPSLLTNKVWPIVREGQDFIAINLVNLLGIKSPEWGDAIENPPDPLEPATLRIQNVEREVHRIWISTPDTDSLVPKFIDSTSINKGSDGSLTIQIPSLLYWNLLVIEWKE
jgi:dextranase